EQNLIIWGDYSVDIDESNTVNGRPVYYWINRQDMEVPPDAGYVALINCTGITVRNQNLSNNNIGILLASTTNSMIANSTFSSNTYGIYCTGSGNTITGNTVKNNPSIGIFISSSSNTLNGNYITASSTGISFNLGVGNTIVGNQIVENAVGMRFITHAYDDCARDNLIYSNNFIDNDQNVYNMHLIFSPDPINIWDNGTIGNYWDDYMGTDSDGDGVGDSPYVIDANNQDNYPLMAPIPEFPSWASMLLILIVLTVAIAIYKRKLLKTPIH
ncbi:MAG: right-handed parallel beta-helix repeat-containing protein, partial [Candidatus Bathyarchaeota archaeon]|nr:right-handed parallel beta-helix repeat-containing protein [Candidatus Bathyarchaeota archaeon]